MADELTQTIVCDPSTNLGYLQRLTWLFFQKAFELLLMQLATAGVCFFCHHVLNHASSYNKAFSVQFDLVLPSPSNYLKDHLRLLLMTACLAVFFPLWIQAMIHFENVIVLLMMLVSVDLRYVFWST
jgi:hypothetical protein